MSNEVSSVLLALIALFTAVVTVGGAAWSAWMAYRMKRLEKGLNGRMDETVNLARAEAHQTGYAEGLKAAATGVVKAENIPLGTREMAAVMADTAIPPPTPPDPRKPSSDFPSKAGGT